MKTCFRETKYYRFRTEKYVKDFLGGDGKINNNEDKTKYLSACDAYLKKYKPDVLIYTPSAESGVDVSITNYFSHHFCFFFGVLQVDAILQMMARIRDVNCPKYFWCKQWVSLPDSETIRSPLAEKIAKVVDQNLVRDIILSMSGEDNEEQLISVIRSLIYQSKTPHYHTATKLTAIANYEKSNLRDCVLESLEAHGYFVNLVTAKDSYQANEEVKAATKEIKEHNCQDIFNAEDMPLLLADKPLAFDAGWDERCKRIKASFRRRLPGIENSQRWTAEFIYKLRYQDPGFIDKQELFWLLENPDVAKTLQQEKYHSLCRKFIEYEHISLWKIKTRLATISALRELGIYELLDNPDKEYTNASPEILAIWEKAHKIKYRQILGRNRGQQPIRYVGSLLKMIGCSWQSKQVRVGKEESIRIYRLDRKLLEEDDRLVVLNCINRKYQKYLTDEVEHLDWSITTEVEEKLQSKRTSHVDESASPNLSSTKLLKAEVTKSTKSLPKLASNQPQKNLETQTATSVDIQRIDTVTATPKNLYKPDGVPVTKKETEFNAESSLSSEENQFLSFDKKVQNKDGKIEIEVNNHHSDKIQQWNNVISPLRLQLTDYQDKEIVWFKSAWGWFKGWICKIAHHNGDFVRVCCDEINSWGYLIDSPLNIAPGDWVYRE